MTFDEWYATQRHQLSNEQVCRVIWDAATKAERERCAVLTDDMLRYAMAAIGTGSPSDAEMLRAFWLHAVIARDSTFGTTAAAMQQFGLSAKDVADSLSAAVRQFPTASDVADRLAKLGARLRGET